MDCDGGDGVAINMFHLELMYLHSTVQQHYLSFEMLTA